MSLARSPRGAYYSKEHHVDVVAELHVTANDVHTTPNDPVSTHSSIMEQTFTSPIQPIPTSANNDGDFGRSADPIAFEHFDTAVPPTMSRDKPSAMDSITLLDHNTQQTATIAARDLGLQQPGISNGLSDSSRLGPVFTIVGGVVTLVMMIFAMAKFLHWYRNRSSTSNTEDLERGRRVHRLRGRRHVYKLRSYSLYVPIHEP